MSVIQSVWSPPHHAATTQRDGAPTDNISNNNIAPQTQAHSHHFHFPPASLLAATTSFRQHLRAEAHKLAHAADGERGLPASGRSGTGSVSSWSPPTDIRQTRLAYHIEIEVPGTTNKEELLIQWLGPSMLVVRGETERPFVGHGKAAEGAFQFEQGEEGGGDGYANGGTGSVGSGGVEQEPRAQDGTHGHDVGGGGICIQDEPPRQLERQTSLKQNEHDGRHAPNGFTYQTSTGSKHLGDHNDNTTQDGGVLQRMITDPNDECADIPMFLLEERKTGSWQRTFTLPHDIEMKALRARLEGGLLRIDIPTKDVSAKPGVKVEIE